MSSLQRTYARRAARDKGLMASKKKAGTARSVKMRPKLHRTRAKRVEAKKPWVCACGRSVKKGEDTVRWLGFHSCTGCFNTKAPDFYAKRGWGKPPKF